jgi:hypothetical protein
METIEIQAEAGHVYRTPRGGRITGNHYQCTGPDGRRISSSNLRSLRALLKERYPAARVTVKEAGR